MKEYLDITRKPIFVTMKTILFFSPILLITNKIYIWKYGDYVFNFSKINENLDINHCIFSVLIFCVISFVAYGIERYIFPEIILSSKNIKPNEKALIWFDKYSINKYGFNIYKKFLELYPDQYIRINLIQEVMFIPIMLILWLIVSNTILGYISIILIIYITYQLGKIIRGTLNKYDNEHRPTT